MRRTETYRENRFRRQCLFSDFFLIFFSPVKTSEKEFKKFTKKLLRTIALSVAFYPAFLAASQSTIQEKIILSPDTLWHSITSGNATLSEKFFLNSELVLASKNLPKNMNTFYQGLMGAGYNVPIELGVIGLGIDLKYTMAPKAQATGFGGVLKGAFIWGRDDFNSEHYFDQSTAVLTGDATDHRSVGQPLFWALLTYNASVLKKEPFSPENGEQIVRGNMTQGRLEAFFSLKEWVIGADISAYSYKEEKDLKTTFLPIIYNDLNYTNFTFSHLPAISGAIVGNFQVIVTD